MRKILSKIFILVLAFLILGIGIKSKAATGYSYDHNKKLIYSAEGLIYDHSFDGNSLGVGYANLTSPEDFFIFSHPKTDEIKMYLTDSKANSIYVLDEKFGYLTTYTSFHLDPADFTDDQLAHISSAGEKIVNETTTVADIRAMGDVEIQLKNPKATYRSVITKFADDSLDNRDYIYVCDYDNYQVLCIDAQTLKIKLVITDPNEYENVLVFEAKTFQPQKVVTDNAGRIYIIANGVYEGILQFDADGTYKRFTGVNNVKLTAWDIFWLSISTEAQYESRKSYINTTFTSMAVDVTGTFIYSTAAPIKNSDGSINSTTMIKKLNPAGKDVLRRNGYAPPQGDLTFVASTANGSKIAVGPSTFNAIAVNEYGMYTVVDQLRCRLFTYDNEGNLLYISGESGKYTNVLSGPVAIQYYEGNLIVLDKNTKELKVFVSTEIGGYINKAVEAEYRGDIDSAAEYWKQVIKFNANYEYAYVGVGKMYLKEKEYKTAMEYFKNGSSKLQYSEAYKLYRNGLIKRYAPTVLYVILGLAVVGVVIKVIRRKKGKGKPKQELDVGDND